MKKKKNNKLLLLILSFFIACIIGYVCHYCIINWNSFFAVCEDGNSPDKYGCCFGEEYADIGAGLMACCPDSGDYCYPPIK